MLRLTPEELAGAFERRGLERVRAESVRIDDPRYYRGVLSRPSWIPVRTRWWLPLPGMSEQAAPSCQGATLASELRADAPAMTIGLDFLGIGAQKAGTTSLHEYMRTHPQLYLPEAKEQPFFTDDDGYAEGWETFSAVAFHGAPRRAPLRQDHAALPRGPGRLASGYTRPASPRAPSTRGGSRSTSPTCDSS